MVQVLPLTLKRIYCSRVHFEYDHRTVKVLVTRYCTGPQIEFLSVSEESLMTLGDSGLDRDFPLVVVKRPRDLPVVQIPDNVESPCREGVLTQTPLDTGFSNRLLRPSCPRRRHPSPNIKCVYQWVASES